MLLYLSVLFIGFLILAYSIRLFRSPFYSLAENSLALVNSLLLKIDEEEKVALVQKNNTKLLISLFKMLINVLLAICISSIPFLLYLFLTEKNYDDLEFSTLRAIVTLSAGSTLGFVIPVKKKSTEGYSELSQLLHRMALNNYAIAHKLFKFETKRLSKKGIEIKSQFVIVSGLARAGTTSLMNRLSENDKFKSLDYSNMPFLTAPNIWKKFYKPNKVEKKERSHKDGIMIGLDSNEALEEYFFKIIDNDSFIKEDFLEQYEISEKSYNDYISYQAIIRNSNDKIYLAKNNNLLLRYESMRNYNPDFLAVFLFREPLSHAASLLEKHKEYSNMQKEDPFVLDYMNWLGHHEFGLNQKVFQFSDEAKITSKDKLSLDYWLEVWINYYGQLLLIDKTNCLYINYDNYCKNPSKNVKVIFDKFGINNEATYSLFENVREINEPYSEDLVFQALEIYQNLNEKIY